MRLPRPSLRTALWTAVLVAAALVGLILYAQAQEDRKDARVEAVDLYIRQVNGVRRGLDAELMRVNATYRRFAAGGSAPRLDEAVRTVRTMRRRVEQLEPPPEAEKLRAEILELVGLQIGLAEEVRAIGRALPNISSETKKLEAAGRRLVAGIRGGDSLDAQAAAFGRYARDVEMVARKLSALDTPAVLEPGVQSETKRLRRLARLARGTQAALAAEKPAEAGRLSEQLAKAASTSTIVTKAQRKAIAAYSSRIRQIGEQERAIEREHARLRRALAERALRPPLELAPREWKYSARPDGRPTGTGRPDVIGLTGELVQIFAEPVALSSAVPGDFPLPRTVAWCGFDLLALRARRNPNDSESDVERR